MQAPTHSEMTVFKRARVQRIKGGSLIAGRKVQPRCKLWLKINQKMFMLLCMAEFKNIWRTCLSRCVHANVRESRVTDLDCRVARADGGRGKDGKEEEGETSRERWANEGAFNFKNSVGGCICVFVQSLVWLIRFKWRVFFGVSELAAVLRICHVQFKSTQESYLALRSAATKEVFSLW